MASKKNNPLRFGLYGEEDLLLPDFIHCETMEYRSKKHNWVIAPHVHSTLFQIFFIYSGSVTYLLESGRHTVKRHGIITIPENTVHGLEVGKNIQGMVLTISSSFVETLFISTPTIYDELNRLRIIKEFGNKRALTNIRSMVSGLHEELHDEFSDRGKVLQSYLYLLLSKIYRLAKDRSERSLNGASRSVLLFRSFQKNVKRSATPMKSIKEYASELNISSVHLNRICQATVGKSALQIVHEFLFLEAEKYIRHTDYSISEIAYRLNFEDPAYFSRFFRKVCGVSPRYVRQMKDKN